MKKNKCGNLDNNEKEQLRKYTKKNGKKAMRDDLDDEQKQQLKIEDNRMKKAKHGNLNVDEEGQMRIYEKNGRKMCVITSMMNKKNI